MTLTAIWGLVFTLAGLWIVGMLGYLDKPVARLLSATLESRCVALQGILVDTHDGPYCFSRHALVGNP